MTVNKTIISVIVFWIILGILFCFRVPYDQLALDYWGHIDFTKIIALEHRLPAITEGWETFQPPLYYLINSLIFPNSLSGDKILHIITVRLLSVIYGAISLFMIAWFLRDVTKNTTIHLLTLLFIATTPSFILNFTTYNNDSLATVLSIALFVFGYKLIAKWGWGIAVIVLFLATAALYTKVTTILVIAFIIFYSLIKLFQTRSNAFTQLNIIAIMLFSISLWSPWVIFHNYKNTGSLFISRAASRPEKLNEKIDKEQVKNIIGIVFKIPRLQINEVDYIHEWDDPWLHTRWDIIHPATKRYDFFAGVFIGSVIGDGVLTNPHVAFIWAMYFIHLIAYIFGLKQTFSSNIARMSTLTLGLIHLTQIISIASSPLQPQAAMTYRYICWTWIFWAVLYASMLSSKSKFTPILKRGFLVGIIIQTYIAMTLTGYIE